MSTTNNKEVVLKLVTAGQSSVGKTSLLERFHSNSFSEIRPCTILCDFQYHIVNKFNLSLRLQLWDITGYERFRNISPFLFRLASGLTLIYDITSRSSFENIQYWIDEVFNATSKPNPAIILIGNKCDLEGQRQVSKQEGLDFAQQNGFLFFETSAKTAFNVELAYQQLLNDMIEIV